MDRESFISGILWCRKGRFGLVGTALACLGGSQSREPESLTGPLFSQLRSFSHNPFQTTSIQSRTRIPFLIDSFGPAFAISAGNRLTPVDLYHDADGNLCLLGRADFSGDVIIHEYRGDGGVGERKDKVVGGLVMWPVDMGDEVDVKGKGKA